MKLVVSLGSCLRANPDYSWSHIPKPRGILLLCLVLLTQIGLGGRLGFHLVSQLALGGPLPPVETAVIAVLLATPIAALVLLVALWQHKRWAFRAYLPWGVLAWLELLGLAYLAAGIFGKDRAIVPTLVGAGMLGAVLFIAIGRYVRSSLTPQA